MFPYLNNAALSSWFNVDHTKLNDLVPILMYPMNNYYVKECFVSGVRESLFIFFTSRSNAIKLFVE